MRQFLYIFLGGILDDLTTKPPTTAGKQTIGGVEKGGAQGNGAFEDQPASLPADQIQAWQKLGNADLRRARLMLLDKVQNPAVQDKNICNTN